MNFSKFIRVFQNLMFSSFLLFFYFIKTIYLLGKKIIENNITNNYIKNITNWIQKQWMKNDVWAREERK